MKNKVKKLTLNKETLRDLTAQNAEQVKGGRPKATVKTCAGYRCTHTWSCRCTG